VLHVLPHPGGGGERYVELLSAIDGWRPQRVYLASSPSDAKLLVARSALRVHRAAAAADLVHVHGEVASLLCLPRLATRPSVVTLHGLNLLRRLNGALRPAAVLSLRLLVRLASKTICVSRAEYEEASRALGAGGPARLALICNGVPQAVVPDAAERRGARQALGIGPRELVAVYAGSLEAHKDPLTVARAVAQLAAAGEPLVLLLAGEGPLRAELESIGALSPGAIRTLGHCSNMRHLLAAADVFTLPSVREGLSFALLEAMSAGVAPLVSDAPANIEAVGDAGIVVARGDRRAFAEALRRLCHDSGARAELASRARERVVGRYRADEMLRQTRAVYEEAFTRGAARARRERS
jgi:glycosyltransferase involved in cell wall biosynthesis